jgi:AcrR family transcriptional regulator
MARHFLQAWPNREVKAAMTSAVQEILDQEIPGVRPADQKRSRILQDKFVSAGRKVLLKTRLDDLSIPVLAKAAGSSVGGFYSRFESKEAFFEFLRKQMLLEHLKLYDARLARQLFEGKTHHDVTESFVDVMLTVFSGPWRGVLREAYSVIPERPESWAPMKARGQYVRALITELYRPLVKDADGLEERVSIAVQLLFSALNNEMMNPNLAFSIEDPKFRFYLIAAFDALVSEEAITIGDTPS